MGPTLPMRVKWLWADRVAELLKHPTKIVPIKKINKHPTKPISQEREAVQAEARILISKEIINPCGQTPSSVNPKNFSEFIKDNIELD